jgi:hypothetical protein
MTDSDFLSWVADRLVFVKGDSEYADFVQRLRETAAARGHVVTDNSETLKNALARIENLEARKFPEWDVDVFARKHLRKGAHYEEDVRDMFRWAEAGFRLAKELFDAV